MWQQQHLDSCVHPCSCTTTDTNVYGQLHSIWRALSSTVLLWERCCYWCPCLQWHAHAYRRAMRSLLRQCAFKPITWSLCTIPKAVTLRQQRIDTLICAPVIIYIYSIFHLWPLLESRAMHQPFTSCLQIWDCDVIVFVFPPNEYNNTVGSKSRICYMWRYRLRSSS